MFTTLRACLVISLVPLFCSALPAKEADEIKPQADAGGGLKLRMICGDQATDARLARVKEFPEIQVVEAFGSAGFSDAGLAHLAALPKLRSLSLGGLHLTAAGLGSLRGNAALKTLAIHETPLTIELAEIIASFPNLETLRLRPCEVEAGAWKPLTKLPRLRDLQFTNSLAAARRDELLGWEDFNQLETVSLYSPNTPASVVVARLAGNQNLRELRLTKILVDEDAASSILKLQSLQKLNIHYASATPEAVKILAQLKTLQHLGIYGDEVQERDLAMLHPFQHLQTLDVHGNRISESATHSLRAALHNTVVNRHNWKHNLADLESISKSIEQDSAGNVVGVTILCHEPATDAKVGILHQFPTIERLYLAGKDLTDVGMMELRTIKKLRELWLNAPNITDAGLLHLADIPELAEVNLRTPKATAAGIAKLKGLLPNVRITVDD